MNHALLIATAAYHAKHGDWPVARDLQLSRLAPDDAENTRAADAHARAARSTLHLVRQTVREA